METAEVVVIERERHASAPGISWGAVVGGAFVGAALSLILLALGAGFGLSAVSPWSNTKPATLDAIAIVWLIVTQIVASLAAGYLAGRLRTSWHAIHSDEVHFRDTANGLVAWAVGVVMAVAFLASAASSMVGAAINPPEAASDNNAYYVDRMFRSDRPLDGEHDVLLREEAARIFANSLHDPLATDNAYLAQLVSARTTITPADAQARVFQALTDARQSEDQARKTTARMLFWTFIALILGAFTASFAATMGGRQRDHVRMI